ncbi:MAG: DUF1566 domain-containing protein [Spirochaetes bacterium]|nr:DUF1566 domain-containing protein [Spirochaetota bacterium]
MKNQFKLFGLAVLATAIIFSFAACKNDPDTGDGMDYKVGDAGPGGGKVFYASKTGFTMTDNNQLCHYLEAAPSDQSTTLLWASSSHTSTSITGTGTAIGTGRKNTALILATDANAPAAKACKDYTVNGLTGWFLPSKDELDLMYKNLAQKGLGGFKTIMDNTNCTNRYWSSSQSTNTYAWDQDFSDGEQYGSSKDGNKYSVRAVRAF